MLSNAIRYCAMLNWFLYKEFAMKTGKAPKGQLFTFALSICLVAGALFLSVEFIRESSLLAKLEIFTTRSYSLLYYKKYKSLPTDLTQMPILIDEALREDPINNRSIEPFGKVYHSFHPSLKNCKTNADGTIVDGDLHLGGFYRLHTPIHIDKRKISGSAQ